MKSGSILGLGWGRLEERGQPEQRRGIELEGVVFLVFQTKSNLIYVVVKVNKKCRCPFSLTFLAAVITAG